jgi:histidine triad (HIT) family protein
MSSIFTKINRNKEIPCYKIAEDENFLAFDVNNAKSIRFVFQNKKSIRF